MRKILILITIFYISLLRTPYVSAKVIRVDVVDSDLLSLEVKGSGEIDFGVVKAGGRAVSAGSDKISVKNNGDVISDLKVSLVTNNTDFSVITSTFASLGLNEIRLFGMFMSGSEYPDWDHFDAKDLISTSPVLCSSTVFAWNRSSVLAEKGINVAPGKERYMYFRFDAPGSISVSTQTLNLSVIYTAVKSEVKSNPVSISRSGGTVDLYGGTKVIIPEGALTQDVEINIEQNDIDEIPTLDNTSTGEKAVAAYTFSPDGTTFNKAVEIVLLFGEMEVKNRNIDKSTLRIFWWDGFNWRLQASTVNLDENTVTAKVWHFSTYAVFPLASANLDSYYRPKRKIITPATAGNNDYIQFDNLSGEYKIKIFDCTGRPVCELDSVPQWWGKDDYGNIVESGTYIYQLEFEQNGKKKILSGTVTVAK